MTELYALHETDRQSSKPMTINDWLDSCHAAAALPYCDDAHPEARHGVALDSSGGRAYLARFPSA